MKIRFNIAKCLCVCHRIYGWLNVLHRYVCCAGLIMQHRVTQYSSIYFDYEEGKTVAKSGDKHFYMPDDFVGDRLPARNSHSILFSKWEALENGLIRLTNACVEWNHRPPRKKRKEKKDEKSRDNCLSTLRTTIGPSIRYAYHNSTDFITNNAFMNECKLLLCIFYCWTWLREFSIHIYSRRLKIWKFVVVGNTWKRLSGFCQSILLFVILVELQF